MSYIDLRTAIISRIQTLTKIEEVFGYPQPKPDKMPYATVEALENASEYADTASNLRIYTFRIRLYYARTIDETNADMLENAELAVLRALDDLLDDFDTNYTLSGACDGIIAVESKVDYATTAFGTARMAEIELKCRKLKRVV